jgi:hypothetical protein
LRLGFPFFGVMMDLFAREELKAFIFRVKYYKYVRFAISHFPEERVLSFSIC